MLEVVVRAAICPLGCWPFVVQLCLWTLQRAPPAVALAPWTAVLVASVAMPALQLAIPSPLPPLRSRSFSSVRHRNPRTARLPFPVISSSDHLVCHFPPSDRTTARGNGNRTRHSPG